MTYLTVEQLSKNFGIKPLFENLTFGLSKGDKTALVAPNGTGKSTLLRILAGKETPDDGEVMVQNNVHIGFLEQEPELDSGMTIREFVTQGNSETADIVQQYEQAAKAQAESFNSKTQERFEKALANMEAAGAWDYEQRMHQILGKLDIHQLDQSIASLSGGERKRVALAFVLLDSPDLLLLDEPTNHLDVEMIEWLEQYLAQSSTTLFMVTHDRYFLDRVCNHILEIDDGTLYHHKGNYEYYLRKKAERKQVEQTQIDKAGQLLKKELDWLHRSPKARTGKSKARQSAIDRTAELANRNTDESSIQLDVNMQRMGGKILELSSVCKQFGDKVILDNFSYSFKRGERIGIIGKNGTGKSTFLNVLTGDEPADSGVIDKGSTIVYGHYKQKGLELDESKRVIEVLKEVAHIIELADGSKVSASQFLEYFMFSPDMQYTPVSKLSGGERRRLALMMVLIKNPNFLILDEPTNDLDLITLNRLEEFLLNFGGCLIIVSHDRFFMDKLVQHYLIFEGDGVILNHHGTYLEYREWRREKEAREKEALKKGTEKPSNAPSGSTEPVRQINKSDSEPRSSEKRAGLSYKEKKEYRRLEKELDSLEDEKSTLEAQISSGTLDYSELEEVSDRYGKLQKLIEEKGMLWLKLAEKAES